MSEHAKGRTMCNFFIHNRAAALPNRRTNTSGCWRDRQPPEIIARCNLTTSKFGALTGPRSFAEVAWTTCSTPRSGIRWI